MYDFRDSKKFKDTCKLLSMIECCLMSPQDRKQVSVSKFTSRKTKFLLLYFFIHGLVRTETNEENVSLCLTIFFAQLLDLASSLILMTRE